MRIFNVFKRCRPEFSQLSAAGRALAIKILKNGCHFFSDYTHPNLRHAYDNDRLLTPNFGRTKIECLEIFEIWTEKKFFKTTQSLVNYFLIMKITEYGEIITL
jgi:hypothetical protein